MLRAEASELLAILQTTGMYLAIAESLTGGLLAAEIVAVPGASKVFLGSITAYQNSIKRSELNIAEELLASHGAVSAQVAEAMAAGVRAKFARAAGISPDRVIGVATTGVAGPEPDGQNPVGLVYLGFALPGGQVSSRRFDFSGDRSEIRHQAVRSAFSELREQIRQ